MLFSQCRTYLSLFTTVQGLFMPKRWSTCVHFVQGSLGSKLMYCKSTPLKFLMNSTASTSKEDPLIFPLAETPHVETRRGLTCYIWNCYTYTYIYIHIYIYICVCIHDFDHLLALCLDNNDMGFVPVVLDGGGFYTVTFVQGSAGLGCFVG